jgi:hypothetical protein
LTPTKSDYQAQCNKEHAVRSFVDDWIETDLYISNDVSVGMTGAQIADHFHECGHLLTGTMQAQKILIAAAVQKKGVESKQVTLNGARYVFFGSKQGVNCKVCKVNCKVCKV